MSNFRSYLINTYANTGYMYSWGYNNKGQLGLGDTTDRYEPTQVGTKRWKQVATGNSHTIAIDTDGYLWGWGANGNSELGLGYTGNVELDSAADTTDRYEPTRILFNGDIKKISQVSTGGHTMVIDTNGYLWGWGDNSVGQLGLGNSENKKSPFLVDSVMGKTWKQVSTGGLHTMAIDTDGRLWGCGYHISGQLGIDTSYPKYVFVEISTKTWKQVAAGNSHTMAIDTDGYLWGWGNNYYGQLGLGDTTTRYEPVQVGTKKWKYIYINENDATVAIDINDYLWGWGYSDYGALCLYDYDPDTRGITTPTPINYDKKWKQAVPDYIYGLVCVDTAGNLYYLCTGNGLELVLGPDIRVEQIETGSGWLMAIIK